MPTIQFNPVNSMDASGRPVYGSGGYVQPMQAGWSNDMMGGGITQSGAGMTDAGRTMINSGLVQVGQYGGAGLKDPSQISYNPVYGDVTSPGNLQQKGGDWLSGALQIGVPTALAAFGGNMLAGDALGILGSGAGTTGAATGGSAAAAAGGNMATDAATMAGTTGAGGSTAGGGFWDTISSQLGVGSPTGATGAAASGYGATGDALGTEFTAGPTLGSSAASGGALSSLGSFLKSPLIPGMNATMGQGIAGLASYLNSQSGANNMSNLSNRLASMSDPFASQRGIYQGQLNSLMTDPNYLANSPAVKSAMQLGGDALMRSNAANGSFSSSTTNADMLKYATNLTNQNLLQYGSMLGQLSGANANPGFAGMNASQAGMAGVNQGTGSLNNLLSVLGTSTVPTSNASQSAASTSNDLGNLLRTLMQGSGQQGNA